MLQAGDEFARTQRGNNNAYCQDNELAWLDWRLAHDHAAQVEFVRRLIQIRRENPVFQRRAFLAGVQQHHERFKDVLWLRADGAELGDEDWHDPGLQAFGMLLDGTGLPPAQAEARRGDNFLVLFNASPEAVEFTLPPPISGQTWVVTLDTSQEALTVPARGYRSGHVYLLDQGSLALLVDHE
jgi:glycogen operon protein